MEPKNKNPLIRSAARALGGNVGDLAAALATPARTLYGWSCGESIPPPAVQIFLRLIADGRIRRADLEEASR